MAGKIRLKAHAKLNLCLDIIGLRDDGYHLLESVMQSVELHDTVHICRTNKRGVRVVCSGLSVPEKSNSAYKAAQSFFRTVNLPEHTGVEIKITKRIPSQSGMGGGSADAAAVLVGLNRLFKTKLSEDDLSAIGAQVGADVPFCVCGGTRLARGIGEILTKLDDCAECYFVVVKGTEGVSTKEAFEDYDNATELARLRIEKVIDALPTGNFEDLQGNLINVFEQSTRVKEVSQIVEELREFGAIEAAMTGSGSTVFGIFNDKKTAKKCVAEMKNRYPFATITKPTIKGVARF